MAIIGLVGNIGNGKGTVADILVETHGFVKESFANSVKDSCAAIFGWNRAMLEGDTTESRAWREQPDEWWSKKFGYDFSPRYALQLMGTEAGRNVFHSDLWVHTVLRRIHLNPDKNYVLADVRFPNEIKAIIDSGGKIVRVKRGLDPEWFACAHKQNTTPQEQHYILEDQRELMQQKYPSIHYSEWAWIGCHYDIVMDNNCSLEQLKLRVVQILDSVYNNRVEVNEVVS